MTHQDKDLEAFEAWYREHYREAPLVNQDPAIEEIEYSSVAVRLRYDGWQAARDHYAPRMTEKEAIEKAAEGIYMAECASSSSPCPHRWYRSIRNKEKYRSIAIAALGSAGVRFKDGA